MMDRLVILQQINYMVFYGLDQEWTSGKPLDEKGLKIGVVGWSWSEYSYRSCNKMDMR